MIAAKWQAYFNYFNYYGCDICHGDADILMVQKVVEASQEAKTAVH